MVEVGFVVMCFGELGYGFVGFVAQHEWCFV